MSLTNMKLLAGIAIVLSLFSCSKSDSSSSGGTGGGGTTSPTITALTCGGVTFSAGAVANTPFSATGTVPYTGGNAVAYTAGTSIASTGVTGLTATLQAGTLASGAGSLSYTVTGTPTSAGTATFAVSFAGQSCSIGLIVSPPSAATITALACGSGSFSAPATAGSAYAATATVPYSGGNGIAYTTGTAIASTGVTGLTVTLQAGTLATGNGNLTYTVSGTPSAAGTALFAINFGGQSCSLSLTVASSGLTLPAVYNKIYGATSITFDGTFVTIKTSDQPDHKSAYWPTTNPLYENITVNTFTGGAFMKAPNTIATQNITLKIPVNPVAASSHAATPMGVIGVALDGVPFFNQYAAGGVALGAEVNGFDQGWAHPQQSGMYHYHVEPYYLTSVRPTGTKWGIMGFLLDGFPVYGPKEENNTDPTGLDVYHGHTHATADYPAGIYHYHFTMTAPYLNGNGFWGTPGTVTQ